MAQVEATIDSIRIADVCPERTLVLKEKGADNYLPIRISPGQTETLAALLQGLPYRNVVLDHFLADINAADSDVKCAMVYLADNTFYAKLLLSLHGNLREVKCPIGIAIALACRANAPILVDEEVFNKAGVCLPTTRCEPYRKESWWRRLFKELQRERPLMLLDTVALSYATER